MERIQIGSKLKVGYRTHEGMSGKHNEDFLGVFAWKVSDSETFYLGVVADGVGGQTAGEIASHLTVTTIQEYFDKLPQLDDINKHLEQSILAANEAVYIASQQNVEYQGMSTTVAMAAIFANRLYTAYVGDSRLYLMRDGRLLQISVDHTWAQEAIEAGLLSPEEAKTHPNRNVIRRHLGGGLDVQVDHRLVLQASQSPSGTEKNQGTPLRESDTILICSDGLTDMITDESVHESLHKHFYDLPTASSELIDKANAAGGRDNITVVILQVPGKAPAAIVAPVPAAATAAAAPARASITTTATPVAAVAGPMVAQPGPEESSNRAIWLVVGAIALLFILGAAAAAIFLVSRSSGNDPTPEATVASTTEEDATLPAGAPATAAILLTGAASGGQDGSDPLSTPELIPTLRSTPTDTPIPGVSPTRTSASTPATLPTATTSSGSGPSNGGSSPKPTSTTAPPATSVPTATPPPASEPPTSEPPTSEPPTSEPPTSEPPTSEPPTSEPPASEPPTSEPPATD
jgi:protein phosphatase